MEFEILTVERYKQLVQDGYKYCAIGKKLNNEDVGFNEGMMFGLFEIILYHDAPNTRKAYYDIGSPEVVDMVDGIDEVFFFVRRNKLATAA